MPYRSHYNPNQPRVPKGHEGGGQWTDDPYGSHALLQPVSYRPQLPRGLHGPGILPPLTLPPEVAQSIISAVVGNWVRQFEWLSGFNGPNQRAIVEFRAREYPNKDGTLELTSVTTLDRREVNELCKRLGDVQRLTDAAAKLASGATPAIYGTAVHTLVKEAINGPGKTPSPMYDSMPEFKRDPKLKAEVSYVKSIEESGRQEQQTQRPNTGHRAQFESTFTSTSAVGLPASTTSRPATAAWGRPVWPKSQ